MGRFQKKAAQGKPRRITETDLDLARVTAIACVRLSSQLLAGAQLDEHTRGVAAFFKQTVALLQLAALQANQFCSDVETELLVSSVRPTTIGGVPMARETAHHTAAAIAEKILRGMWAAACPDESRPLTELDPTTIAQNLVATMDYLKGLDPFDEELLIGMIKQESAQAIAAYKERLAAAQRNEDMNRIDDPITLRKWDVATYCKVSVRTIERWIASGKLPCAHEGDVYRFSKQTLQILRTLQLSKKRPGSTCPPESDD